ncbi:MAG: DMT family transporter [Desulfobacterales bacterium]
MIGASIALLTALAWAISSIIIKSLTNRIDTLSINTIRMWIPSVIVFAFVLITHRHVELLNTPLQSLMLVIGSGIIAMAIGDTLYIYTLSLLDASIAFTIAQCLFVAMATIAAIVFLDEPFTWITVVGAVLVLCGISLIVSTGKEDADTTDHKKISGKGVAITFVTAIIWTASTMMLKVGATGMDPVLASSMRIGASAIALTIFATPRLAQGTLQLRTLSTKDLVLIAATGLLAYGIAAVGYVTAIQMIGAGKTVLLTATAPLFALPFSMVFLKEKPTRSTIAGILVCVAGICLVVI